MPRHHKRRSYPRSRKTGRRRLGASSTSSMVAAAIKYGPTAARYANSALKAYKNYKQSQPKRTSLHVKVNTEGTGCTLVRSLKTYRAYSHAKKIMRSSEVQKVATIVSGQMTCAFAQQAVGIFNLGNNNDLNNIEKLIQTSMSAGAVRLNSVVGTVGSSSVVVDTMDYALKTMSQDVIFSNSTSCNIFVDFYELVCRSDTSSPVLTTWTNGLNDSYAGSLGYNQPYVTPFQSPTLCSYFKINKVRHCEMAQGIG